MPYFAALRRGQAVGALGVGKISDGDAVDCLVGIVVVGRQVIKTDCHHILRHGGPVGHRGSDAAGALVVAVVVGGAEHPEPHVVQRVCDIPGRREHRVAGWLVIVVDQRLLVQPVHVKAGVKVPQVLVGVGKVVAAVGGTGAGLVVQSLVDQVVAAGGKPHRFHHRRRFRRWGGRRRGRGGRARRRGGGEPCRHRGGGEHPGPHSQRQGNARGDHHAGGNLVLFQRHCILPLSISVMV